MGDSVFGPVFSISNTGNASGTGYDYIVEKYADLPPSTGSLKIAYVRTSTYLSFPPHLSGTYLDELSGWTRGAPYAAFFDDNNAEWYDDADPTKRMKFGLETLPTATTRVLNPSRRNGEIDVFVREMADTLPRPAAAVSGQGTLSIMTDFYGALFNSPRAFRANRITVQVTARAGAPNLAIAIYQESQGRSGVASRIAQASLINVAATGVYAIPFTEGDVNFEPGDFYILFGKSAAAGGGVTIRVYATLNLELYMSTVPAGLRPAGFTTALSVDAGAPATLNPAIGGGTVTEAGGTNTALVSRLRYV